MFGLKASFLKKIIKLLFKRKHHKTKSYNTYYAADNYGYNDMDFNGRAPFNSGVPFYHERGDYGRHRRSSSFSSFSSND